MNLSIDKDKPFKFQVNEERGGLDMLVSFQIKNNCCITKCKHRNIFVASVTCKECEYYQGEMGLYVKCSHPQKL